MKCNYCEEEAVYELDTVDGIVHVCEACDEKFTVCKLCGEIVPVDEARFLFDEDDRKTCFDCMPMWSDVELGTGKEWYGIVRWHPDDVIEAAKSNGVEITFDQAVE